MNFTFVMWTSFVVASLVIMVSMIIKRHTERARMAARLVAEDTWHAQALAKYYDVLYTPEQLRDIECMPWR